MAKEDEETGKDQRADEAEVTSEPDEELAIRWRAPKFLFYRKDARWYAGVIAAGAALLAITVLLRSQLLVSLWLIVPIIVLAETALLSRGMVQPTMIDYALTEEGISIDDVLHPYADFRAFSVVDMDDHYVLRLWPKVRYLLPYSLVLSDEVIPADIREILAEVIPEGDHQATLADWIAHFTKF